MKRLFAFFLTMLCVLAHASGPAAITTVPNGFCVSPVKFNHTLYGCTSAQASWFVTQWGTPTPSMGKFNSSGVAVSASQRAVWTAGTVPVWEMGLNATGITCGNEFDGMFQATDNTNYPGYPAAQTNSAPLSTLSALEHSITVKNVYSVLTPGRCAITQSGILTAVVLHNTTNGNTLFYQVELTLVGNPAPASSFFFTGPSTWGFGDMAWQNYGTTQIAQGTTQVFNLNLLPRIEWVIANSTLPDKNLADWVVSGTYHGIHSWGDAVNTATFSVFYLLQIPK